jgi:hypothetical protein
MISSQTGSKNDDEVRGAEEMSLARARALALVVALVVVALILVIVAVAKDRQSSASYTSGGCPAGAVKISTRPLPDTEQIKINVYNGTGQAGRASQVADDFKNRGFQIGKVGDAPHFKGVAKLGYGPKEVAASTVVRAYFLTNADEGGFDIKRGDDTIDVTIGTQYQQLGTKTEVNQSLAQLGNPSPPPGTCDVS